MDIAHWAAFEKVKSEAYLTTWKTDKAENHLGSN